jgi:hypothetical protein
MCTFQIKFKNRKKKNKIRKEKRKNSNGQFCFFGWVVILSNVNTALLSYVCSQSWMVGVGRPVGTGTIASAQIPYGGCVK